MKHQFSRVTNLPKNLQLYSRHIETKFTFSFQQKICQFFFLIQLKIGHSYQN